MGVPSQANQNQSKNKEINDRIKLLHERIQSSEAEIRGYSHWTKRWIDNLWNYTDWIWWVIIGFFLKEILARWNIWKVCPLISECTRCYNYDTGYAGLTNIFGENIIRAGLGLMGVII